MALNVKIELSRSDGTVLLYNVHCLSIGEKCGWTMDQDFGGFIEDDETITGYTLELHGRKLTSETWITTDQINGRNKTLDSPQLSKSFKGGTGK